MFGVYCSQWELGFRNDIFGQNLISTAATGLDSEAWRGGDL